MTIVESGPAPGEGGLQARITHLDVGRTSDHRLGLVASIVHHGQGQAVGVGMGTHFHYLSHDDFLRVPGRPVLGHLDVLDGRHL